ncbi:MAG: undecaprenyl diphosphate synthase family protein [Candidatus Aenigmarchaeota archaeon]|nr:undecaprenyl diphosphate synthase family protein [Candidatus Aenigmarchaeota archaeon]
MINELNHILFFPDGHRRFADRKGILYREAYALGCKKVLELIRHTLIDEDIMEVSIVALWDYNLMRTCSDLDDFLDEGAKAIVRIGKDRELQDKGITIGMYGEMSELFEKRPDYKQVLEATQRPTTNPRKKLNILLAYSPEREFQRALSVAIDEGTPPLDITFDMLLQHTFSPNLVSLAFMSGQQEYDEQPNPFPYLAETMLHMRNARIYVTNKYFPELTVEDIHAGIEGYRTMLRVLANRRASVNYD